MSTSASVIEACVTLSFSEYLKGNIQQKAFAVSMARANPSDGADKLPTYGSMTFSVLDARPRSIHGPSSVSYREWYEQTLKATNKEGQ